MVKQQKHLYTKKSPQYEQRKTMKKTNTSKNILQLRSKSHNKNWLEKNKVVGSPKRTSFLCKLDLHSFARCCGNNTRICFYLMAFGSTNNLKHTLISHLLTSNKEVYFSTGNGFFFSTKIRVFIELALENIIAWKISHVEDFGIMVYDYATYSTNKMNLYIESIS